MKQLIVLVLSSIALLTGCDLLEEQTEDVKLTIDSSSYAFGEAVVLKLENNTELAISHNLCYATVERRIVGGDWNEVQHQFGDVCEDEMHVLEPGEATTHTSQLAADLHPGVYRLTARVYPDRRDVREEATDPFTLSN